MHITNTFSQTTIINCEDISTTQSANPFVDTQISQLFQNSLNELVLNNTSFVPLNRELTFAYSNEYSACIDSIVCKCLYLDWDEITEQYNHLINSKYSVQLIRHHWFKFQASKVKTLFRWNKEHSQTLVFLYLINDNQNFEKIAKQLHLLYGIKFSAQQCKDKIKIATSKELIDKCNEILTKNRIVLNDDEKLVTIISLFFSPLKNCSNEYFSNFLAENQTLSAYLAKVVNLKIPRNSRLDKIKRKVTPSANQLTSLNKKSKVKNSPLLINNSPRLSSSNITTTNQNSDQLKELALNVLFLSEMAYLFNFDEIEPTKNRTNHSTITTSALTDIQKQENIYSQILRADLNANDLQTLLQNLPSPATSFPETQEFLLINEMLKENRDLNGNQLAEFSTDIWLSEYTDFVKNIIDNCPNKISWENIAELLQSRFLIKITPNNCYHHYTKALEKEKEVNVPVRLPLNLTKSEHLSDSVADKEELSFKPSSNQNLWTKKILEYLNAAAIVFSGLNKWEQIANAINEKFGTNFSSLDCFYQHTNLTTVNQVPASD